MELNNGKDSRMGWWANIRLSIADWLIGRNEFAKNLHVRGGVVMLSGKDALVKNCTFHSLKIGGMTFRPCHNHKKKKSRRRS